MAASSKASGRKAGRQAVLVWNGELTVHRVSELKAEILSALDSAAEVIVDLSGAEEADVAFLQLLCAAHREAEARNRVFNVRGVAPAWFRDLAGKTGFRRERGCSAGCLWRDERGTSVATGEPPARGEGTGP